MSTAAKSPRNVDSSSKLTDNKASLSQVTCSKLISAAGTKYRLRECTHQNAGLTQTGHGLQLAAPQTVTVARDEGMKADREGGARNTRTQAQNGSRRQARSTDPRPHAVVQRNTPFNRETRKLRARSGPKQKSYQVQQLGQQAVVQRGNPTTKKIRRLKAGEGNRALQRAIATQRAGVNQTQRRGGKKPPRGRATINRQKHRERRTEERAGKGKLRHQVVKGQTGARRRRRNTSTNQSPRTS